MKKWIIMIAIIGGFSLNGHAALPFSMNIMSKKTPSNPEDARLQECITKCVPEVCAQNKSVAQECTKLCAGFKTTIAARLYKKCSMVVSNNNSELENYSIDSREGEQPLWKAQEEWGKWQDWQKWKQWVLWNKSPSQRKIIQAKMHPTWLKWQNWEVWNAKWTEWNEWKNSIRNAQLSDSQVPRQWKEWNTWEKWLAHLEKWENWKSTHQAEIAKASIPAQWRKWYNWEQWKMTKWDNNPTPSNQGKQGAPSSQTIAEAKQGKDWESQQNTAEGKSTREWQGWNDSSADKKELAQLEKPQNSVDQKQWSQKEKQEVKKNETPSTWARVPEPVWGGKPNATVGERVADQLPETSNLYGLSSSELKKHGLDKHGNLLSWGWENPAEANSYGRQEIAQWGWWG